MLPTGRSLLDTHRLKKRAKIGDLYLQGVWIKFIQFCYTASEHFRSLCVCSIWRVVHVILTWHQRLNDFDLFISACNALSPAAVDCITFSQLQQQRTFRPTIVQKFYHKLPSVISLMFTQSFNQNFVFLAQWSHCFLTNWVRINCTISVAAFWGQIK